MKKSVYIFYNLLRYRLLSYFIKGEKQEKYKKKYYSLKSYTDQSERKKISLFGIPCFSVRKLHNITSYEFGGFPVVTTLQKRKKLSFYLFGLRIAKWRTKVLQMKPQSAPVGQPRYDYNKFEALLLNKVQRFLFDITEMAVSFAKNGAKLEDADLALLRQIAIIRFFIARRNMYFRQKTCSSITL